VDPTIALIRLLRKDDDVGVQWKEALERYKDEFSLEEIAEFDPV